MRRGNKASAKFLSGSVKLATAAAGEAAKYGVYAGYSLASEDWSDGDIFGHIGSAFGNAYDEMGGLTINVANLGAMLDFVGTVAGRINGSGQSIFGDGSILESLGGIGLLEVNFGREGISASIGMGGIDVGGALYDQVKRGIDYAGLKELAKTGDAKTARTAWDTYVYGDFTQENTAMRIASGKDELRFVDKDFGVDEEGRIRLGETTRSSGGGRIISITDIGDIGDIDTMSVTLGHEAYRNGVVDGNNKEETRAAVIAHTKMAASMRAEGTSFGGNVALDLAVYDYARSVGNMEIMNLYADALYDSSGDFWTLTADGKLVKDGYARVVDEKGNVIISLEDLGMTTEQQYDEKTSLAKMFGISGEKADEIYTRNGDFIQLGNGGGIGGSDYANALAYALTTRGGGVVNNMSNAIFNRMTTEERAEYLKRQVIVGSAFIGVDKGDIAKQLRAIEGLHDENILTGLFYTSFPTPTNNAQTYEYAANYDFMNEGLRDFLNLNLNGSSQYTAGDIAKQRFKAMGIPGSLYHYDPDYTEVTKYTNTDGREVVLGRNKQTNRYEQVNSELYRGTYNYMNGTAHYDFDMRPFDMKYDTNWPAQVGPVINQLVTNTAYNIEMSLFNAFRQSEAYNIFNKINSPERLYRYMMND